MKNNYYRTLAVVDAEDSNLLFIHIGVKLGCLQQTLHPCGGRSRR